MQRTGTDTSCSGCGGDKTSSSVVVPNIHLPDFLGNKGDIVHQALSTANIDLNAGDVNDPTQQLLLTIGDIIAFFSANTNDNGLKPGLDLNALHNNDLANLAGGLGGLATGVGALEKIGALVSVFHFFKYKVLHVISVGLQIANIILAIIGLAMIIGKFECAGSHISPLSTLHFMSSN